MVLTYSNSLDTLQICLMSLKYIFKKFKVADDFINLGSFSISLKMFILNIIVFLCTLKLATNLTNFSFLRKWLNTFPWWYGLDIIPFFERMRSSYSFMMVAASSGFSTLSAFSFNSSISLVSLLTRESISCFFYFFFTKSFCLLGVLRTSPQL